MEIMMSVENQNEDVLGLSLDFTEKGAVSDPDRDWDKALKRKDPGRKKGPRQARINIKTTPEMSKSLKEISIEKKISIGVVVERLFEHWKKNPAEIFEQEGGA